MRAIEKKKHKSERKIWMYSPLKTNILSTEGKILYSRWLLQGAYKSHLTFSKVISSPGRTGGSRGRVGRGDGRGLGRAGSGRTPTMQYTIVIIHKWNTKDKRAELLGKTGKQFKFDVTITIITAIYKQESCLRRKLNVNKTKVKDKTFTLQCNVSKGMWCVQECKQKMFWISFRAWVPLHSAISSS